MALNSDTRYMVYKGKQSPSSLTNGTFKFMASFIDAFVPGIEL